MSELLPHQDVKQAEEPNIQGFPLSQLLPGLTAIDSPTLELIASVGQLVRLTTRAMHSYLGVLVGLQLRVEVMELALEEKRRDYGEGQDYKEVKVVYVPVSNLHSWEVVSERELADSNQPAQDDIVAAIESAIQGG